MRKTWKKALATAVCAALVIGLVPAQAAQITSPGHWATEAINYSVQNGYLTGDENGNINPDRPMNRAEFTAVVLRMAGVTNPQYTEHSFTDLVEGAWYVPYIATASVRGLVNGFGDGTFQPSQPINRQESIAMLARVWNVNSSSRLPLPFEDADWVDDWAFPYIRAMYDRGLIQGSTAPDGTLWLNPANPISFGETATVSYNRTHVNTGTGGSTIRPGGTSGGNTLPSPTAIPTPAVVLPTGTPNVAYNAGRAARVEVAINSRSNTTSGKLEISFNASTGGTVTFTAVIAAGDTTANAVASAVAALSDVSGFETSAVNNVITITGPTSNVTITNVVVRSLDDAGTATEDLGIATARPVVVNGVAPTAAEWHLAINSPLNVGDAFVVNGTPYVFVGTTAGIVTTNTFAGVGINAQAAALQAAIGGTFGDLTVVAPVNSNTIIFRQTTPNIGSAPTITSSSRVLLATGSATGNATAGDAKITLTANTAGKVYRVTMPNTAVRYVGASGALVTDLNSAVVATGSVTVSGLTNGAVYKVEEVDFKVIVTGGVGTAGNREITGLTGTSAYRIERETTPGVFVLDQVVSRVTSVTGLINGYTYRAVLLPISWGQTVEPQAAQYGKWTLTIDTPLAVGEAVVVGGRTFTVVATDAERTGDQISLESYTTANAQATALAALLTANFGGFAVAEATGTITFTQTGSYDAAATGPAISFTPAPVI